MKRNCTVIQMFVSCWLVLVPYSAVAAQIRTVAVTGQSAPGTPTGVTFTSFGIPSLNAAGLTAFNASLSGSGVSSINNFGIWSEGGGSLAITARLGDLVAGGPRGFSAFGQPSLSDSDRVGFWGSAHILAFPPFHPLSAYVSAVWSDRSGALTQLVREGEVLSGTTLSGLASAPYIRLNASGQVAFRTHVTGISEADGIWSDRSGSMTPIVQYGDPVPGAGGYVFRDIGPPALNNLGQIGFRASYSGGVGAGPPAIWSDRGGSLAPVVATSTLLSSVTHPPGTPTGTTFSTFGDPSINDSGQLAFQATIIAAGNNSGIWSEGSGSLALVARQGDDAPGVPDAVNFGALADSPILNALGHVAFAAPITGPGVTTTNDRGIWAHDHLGVLTLVLRESDLLQVAPGDFRTVSSFSLGGFNGLGEVAFSASFTDGTSGVFVSDALVVPEPSTLVLTGFGAGVLMLAALRRSAFGPGSKATGGMPR